MWTPRCWTSSRLTQAAPYRPSLADFSINGRGKLSPNFRRRFWHGGPRFLPKWKGETLAQFFGSNFGTCASNKCLKRLARSLPRPRLWKTWWFIHIFRGRVFDLPCHVFSGFDLISGFRVESIKNVHISRQCDLDPHRLD